jgi:hypothetical protein
MDSADVIVLSPLSPCSLTAGEYIGATSSVSAIAIDGSIADEKSKAAAEHLDKLAFRQNM